MKKIASKIIALENCLKVRPFLNEEYFSSWLLISLCVCFDYSVPLIVTQQIFNECLICDRHSFKFFRCIGDKIVKDSHPHGFYILGRVATFVVKLIIL